ncbi:MAG: glycosyltransferase [Clostridiales bacterium]|nr:glycosyltransferase [Clostridiales bacterium]
MPTISVVMPAYNAQDTISAAVRSVLAQTFTDFELILVEDCSEDGTYALCQAFAEEDKRIRLYRNSENKGVAYSRNRGVEAAGSQWIAFLDSDDMWRREKLERQLRFIEESGADISYTASAFVDEEGKAYRYILHAVKKLTYNGLLKGNRMSCSSVIVRRELMQRTIFLDGQLHEDYAAWLRIVRGTGAAYGLDEPLLIYRVSGASRSGKRVRSGLMVYRTYRAVGYPFAASACMTARYAMYSVGKRMRMHGKGKDENGSSGAV